jgi:hypothetical protein
MLDEEATAELAPVAGVNVEPQSMASSSTAT